MGLDQLGQVDAAGAAALAAAGDVDRQQRVAGLGRGQQVADRADAADAGGDDRHLAEGAALAELLEAAELGDVEAGVGHLRRRRRGGW